MKYKDITFTELRNVFQSYIINEADFKNDDSCGEKCQYFKKAKAAVNCYYDKELCKKHQRCAGTLHDCVHQFDEKMYVCLEVRQCIILSDMYRFKLKLNHDDDAGVQFTGKK